MNRDQYYQGLDPKQLHVWLLISIEAASYCEETGEKYIRFNPLRERTENSWNELTDGDRRSFGGNFSKSIERGRNLGFFSIKKVGRKEVRISPKKSRIFPKETRISPNIPVIQRELIALRAENLDSGKNRVKILTIENPDSSNTRIRILDKDAKVLVTKPIFEPPISVSDSLSMTVTHANREEHK